MSLTDFMAPPVKAEPPAEKAKLTRNGEEVVTLSLRLSRSEWEALVALTTASRTKIQPHIRALIAADFKSRGLRY